MTLGPNQISEYRELKDWSVEVSKTNSIEFNSGSETGKHVIAKALVGHIGVINGYRVSSEVECSNGEIDVVLWGVDDRLSLAVECETSPTEETIQSKLERYVKETPLDEIVVINVTEMPDNYHDALGYVADELGLDP